MGALLNNKGLISMVVFSIGLDLKVISVTVLKVLVIMALFNTIPTTWCLDLFCPKRFLEIGGSLESGIIGLPSGQYLGAEAPPSGDYPGQRFLAERLSTANTGAPTKVQMRCSAKLFGYCFFQ